MAQGLVHFGAALCALTAAAASAQEVALSFTAEQAAAGPRRLRRDAAPSATAPIWTMARSARRSRATRSCASTAARPSRALFDVARTTMPTANPGSLPVETYAALVALMLDENDIVAGEEPLPTDPQLLAAMQVPAGGFSFMAFSPYTARARRGPANAARRLQRSHRRLDCRAARRRLARLAPQLRRAGVQPVARHRHAQRRGPTARVELDDARRLGRRRAARARRHDLRASLRRHRAGARREDRRSALAVHAHARARRFAVSQARPRAARQSALPRHVGRPRRCARRRDRRSRMGHDGRRLPPARRLERRAARRTRQSHGRHDGHGRRGEDSAARRSSGSMPKRARKRGGSARSRSPASPATRAGTAFRSSSAAARPIWTPGSYDPSTGLAYFGTGNTYDTGAAARAERARAPRATRCTRTRRSP